MTIPKFAVLLATFNGSKWIQEQIDSILCQQEVDVTIYIADDESTDCTISLIKRLYGNDNRVVVTELLNKIGSASLNFQRLLKTIKFAKFDYVAFADQDDIWLENKLKSAAASLRLSGADGYSCAVTALWESGVKKTIGQNAHIRKYDYLLEGAGQGCSFVLSQKLATAVAFVITEFGESCSRLHYHDWLVYAVARSMNKRWIFDDVPHMIYRQHSANDTGARGSFSGMLFRLKKLKNGWYFNQVLLIINVILKVNYLDDTAKYLQKNLTVKPNLLQTIQFAGNNLKNGRRRFVDRVIVSVAILLHWHLKNN